MDMVDPTNTDVVCWHVGRFAIQNSKFGILNNEQLHESTSYYLLLTSLPNNQQQTTTCIGRQPGCAGLRFAAA
jgi:hypothetical protein